MASYKRLGRPIKASTTALLKVVKSDFQILLEQKFSIRSKIFSEIWKRPELKDYKQTLDPEKIRKIINNHSRKSSLKKSRGRPLKKKIGFARSRVEGANEYRMDDEFIAEYYEPPRFLERDPGKWILLNSTQICSGSESETD